MKFLIVLALIAAAAAEHKPLTHEQADQVRHAWDKVKHNEVEILHEIFKEHPDIQNKFPQFAGKDLETIKEEASFATHATRIVSFLTEILSLAGNPDTIPAIKTRVNEMGQNHRNRGVTKEQLNEFRHTLTDYVKHHGSLDGDAEQAWNQAFDCIYEVIFSNLDGHPVV
uniref:Globin n=1 Tax=Polypedilum vanderplanki TaxID=319348 RepID=S6BNF5_POLVA|nr:globin [Polypedilum vanderplanki]